MSPFVSRESRGLASGNRHGAGWKHVMGLGIGIDTDKWEELGIENPFPHT